eukprot:754933-Hanusia_phi.AAC.7
MRKIKSVFDSMVRARGSTCSFREVLPQDRKKIGVISSADVAQVLYSACLWGGVKVGHSASEPLVRVRWRSRFQE